MENQVHITLDEKEIEALVKKGYIKRDEISAESITNAIHEVLSLAPSKEVCFSAICNESVIIDGEEWWTKGCEYMLYTIDFSEFNAESNHGNAFLNKDDFLQHFEINYFRETTLNRALEWGDAEIVERFSGWQNQYDANTAIYIDRPWVDEHYHGEDSFTIPDGVTEIGENAFNNCESLTSISIPDSVKKIGYSAFSYCTNLTSITIPDSVAAIEGFAFAHCTSLTSVTIPESVTKIGSHAFGTCTSLTSITIPDSSMEIEENAFYGSDNLTIHCSRGSVAAQYAMDNKIPVAYDDQKKKTKKQDGRDDI